MTGPSPAGPQPGAGRGDPEQLIAAARELEETGVADDELGDLVVTLAAAGVDAQERARLAGLLADRLGLLRDGDAPERPGYPGRPRL